MSVQFISDSSGNTTGVFIPVDEWNMLKEKYKGLEDDIQVPTWHKTIVAERSEQYKTGKAGAEDMDKTLDDIDGKL